MSDKKQIVILGGGFGGVYTALELEKRLPKGSEVDVTLVNTENFLLFTPMLHEVAASDLDPTDIVNPIHKLLKRTNFFCGAADAIDLENRSVTVSHGAESHSHTLKFDHLVLSLGSSTHFFGLPGLAENALTMKSLGDAMHLRNQTIALLEEANFECCKDLRSKLLTFVVAGGGFAGVETVAALSDFIHGVLPVYRNLKADDVRVILAHSGKVILPELNPKLGNYAGKLLSERGIEIRFGTKVCAFENGKAKFTDNTEVDSSTVVWTAGSMPNPLIETLSCKKEKGRVFVDPTLAVPNFPGVWALGDCAAIPKGQHGFHPPTAQHAIREARTIAKNICAQLCGDSLTSFSFKTLGQLASLGHRKGVAQVFGICFSGFVAWWLWRTIYLMKLPRFEKKMRVALNWALDIMFSKDNVQLPQGRGTGRPVSITLAEAA